MDEAQFPGIDPSTVEEMKRRFEEVEATMGPRIEAMLKAAQRSVVAPEVVEGLRAVATSPQLKLMRETVDRMNEQMARIRESALAAASIQVTEDTMPQIELPKPKEAYILEAQYDMIGLIRDMGSLLEQSLEVQGQQIEVLKAVERSTDQQTGLTRCVLGVAIFAAVASIAVPLALRFLT